MKIKIDFVTNSSSASFTVLKKHLKPCQIQFIYEHIEVGMILASQKRVRQYDDPWFITENDISISGNTGMDNFDMFWFLREIGIKEEHIKWDHSNDWNYDDVDFGHEEDDDDDL